MKLDFPAIAFITLDVPRTDTWTALTNTDVIEQYVLGSAVETEWKVGGRLVCRAEGGTANEIGEILAFESEQLLEFSCLGSRLGSHGEPEEAHNVTVVLTSKGKQTRVSVIQDNNPNDEARALAEKHWARILGSLKEYVESDTANQK